MGAVLMGWVGVIVDLTLTLLGFYPTSIEVDGEGHARLRHVLPDSGRLPLGPCPSPWGFSNPPPDWLTHDRNQWGSNVARSSPG